MASPAAKRTRTQDGTGALPATPSLPSRRVKQPKPSFGRPQDGPASSPPPCPPQVVTPEPRRSRRTTSATLSPMRSASRSPGDGDQQSGETSETRFDVGGHGPLLTPSTSPRPEPSTEAPVPPILMRSSKSAPASTTISADRGTGLPRPSPRQRSASDWIPRPPRTVAEVHRDIADTLMKKEPRCKEKGHNYIAKVTRADGDQLIYKVGLSKSVESRLKNIKNRCKLASLQELPQSQLGHAVEMVKVVEAMVKKELDCFRYDGPCSCKTRHLEYYRVESEEIVLQAHARWRTFCSHQPWDDDGCLRRRWRYRLDHRPQLGEQDDYAAMVKIWDHFMNPSFLQKRLWDVKDVWTQISPHLWHIIAFMEAMIIALLSSSSVCAWIWVLLLASSFTLGKLEFDELWIKKDIAAYLHRWTFHGDLGSSKGPDITVGEEPLEAREETAEEGLMETDSPACGAPEMQASMRSPERKIEHRDACIEPSGGWNGDEWSDDESVHSQLVDDYSDVEGVEATMDADASIITADTEVSIVGNSKEYPIVIA